MEEQKTSQNKRNWEEQVEYARSRDILDVAHELGMDLVRSGRDYRWKEHDSMVITPETNLWNWFRESKGGDVISLVEKISEVDFNQAIHFLNEGSFKEFTAVERIKEPFQYYLKPYERPFEEARDYLRNQRGLSDETIDFFYSQRVLAQANAKLNGSIEPVIVFKSLNSDGKVIGANLQGIHENREKWPERGYAKRILRNSDGMTGLHVDIGQPKRLIFGESPIDIMSYYELHKEELQDVRLVSMDGLKESVIGNHLTLLESESSGRPIRWSREEIAKSLDVAIKRGYFSAGKNQDLLTLAVDNDEAGRNFIRSLREKGAVITEALPELQAGKEKSDWNDILKNPPIGNTRLDAMEEEQEKALEQSPGQEKKTEGTIGDFPENQGAAPLPEANESQPLNDLSPNQTQPQPFLHFTINEGGQSIAKRYYHPISSSDLTKLNRYASNLQQAANWYLNTVADSTITYFYQEGSIVNSVQIRFDKDKFQHLTGVFPYKEGQTAEQTVIDFAHGKGDFDEILIANQGAAFDKLKVLPDLSAIVDANSFYFGDLSDVPKLHTLDMSKAIKSKDEDIVLALRTVDETTFPASLMKLREGLKIQLEESNQERIILGVFRDRDGTIEQLSINEKYVNDGGQEMLSILKNKQYEESTDERNVEETVGHSIDNVTGNVLDLHESFEITDADEKFTSPRTEVRDHLAKRVEEIISNDRETDAFAESMSYKVEQQQGEDTVIHPKVRELIDQGQIKQWDRQPNLYFVKGLRKVALELTEDGKLQLSSLKRFGPRNDRDLSVVNDILKSLDDDISQKDINSIEPTSNNSNQQTLDTSSQAEVESFNYEKADPYEISQHAFDLIRQYSQSPEELKEYVEFMSKFPELSPRNVALIHEQWKGANAVATYNQWKALGKQLGIRPEDVIQTKASYTNKKTGETKEVLHQNLSVKSGEKSKITLFRPLTVKMIPVFDENGRHLKNEKGNPKYKRLSEATPEEKRLVKEGRLPVKQFPERDPKTGGPKFTTYKVFELSQTTLKPESYPKAMPNRHFNFNLDQVKTDEVLEGLCDYADKIGVEIKIDGAGTLDNAKGAFFPDRQLILLNPDNTPGEKIATTIHELAHATLHNPKLTDLYKEKVPNYQKELEAEMTSYLVSNYFGLDTSEKAIPYIANWTGKLEKLDDKQLADSLGRIHRTVTRIHKHVSQHMSFQPRHEVNQEQNLSFQARQGLRR